MSRKYLFPASLLIVLVVTALLVSGSPLLTLSLSQKHNVPLGNFITWIGLIALPAPIYFGIKRLRQPQDKIDRVASSALKVIWGLCILWLPICFLLAGNISFTFSQRTEFQGGQAAMKIFWYFNYFLVGGAVLTLLLYGIVSMARKAFERK